MRRSPEGFAGQGCRPLQQQRLWLQRQAADAEKAGQWFAAAFHLSRLIDAEPADASLFLRRGLAYAHLGRWADAGADLLWAAALPPPAGGKEDGP